MASKRRIEIDIVGDAKSLERAFSRAGRSASGFQRSIASIGKGVAIAGAAFGAGLAANVAVGVRALARIERISAQTDAVLRATGGGANVSREQIERFANALEKTTSIEAETVQEGQNLLLTFRAVRNEVGKGNAIFDRATKSILNLSTAGFGSVDSVAKQLGKALNDPIRGMTALGRAGVTFTEQQRNAIKAFVESNRLLNAQKVILREVERQVGGSARALGETLTGRVRILGHRFGELQEQIAGAALPALEAFVGFAEDLVPTLGRAMARLSAFFGRIQEAQGLEAKLDVVWTGVEDAATAATDALGAAVAKIDFKAVWAKARGIADGLQARLEEVNFEVIGDRIGDAFVDAVRVAVPAAKDIATRVNAAASEIDFEALGRKLGPALATALVTAFVTLLDPAFWARNWDLALAVALTVFRVRLLGLLGKLASPLKNFGTTIAANIVLGVARISERLGVVVLLAFAALPRIIATALRPILGVVGRVFGRLGRLARFTVAVLGIKVALNAVVDFAKRVGRVFADLGGSIATALDRAWEGIKRNAIKAALAIIEPFTHIPRKLGGGVFQDLKRSWQDTLAVMEADADKSTDAIQRALNGIKDKTVTVTVQTRTVTVTGDRKRPVGAAPARTTGDVVGQAAAASAEKAAGDTAKVQTNVTAAETMAAKRIADARKRAAAEAKRAAAAAAKALEVSREAFATLMDTLSLREDQAAATKGLRDDLRVARETQSAIAAQIKVEGETVDLLRQQFDAEQRILDIQRQIAENRRTAQQAQQFRALGLTSTGETRAPSVQALTGRLASLREQVKGTVLDTDKTRAQLAGIAQVLRRDFGKVGRDVRLAILQLFQDIAGALEGGAAKIGPLTKTSGLKTKQIVAGLGLTADQVNELRGRLSGFNTAGRALGAPPRLATAAAGGFGGQLGTVFIELHSNVSLDGQKLGSNVTRHQQKVDRRNPPQKRGPNRSP